MSAAALTRYIKLLDALGRIRRKGKPVEVEADVLDEMDTLWADMTEDERTDAEEERWRAPTRAELTPQIWHVDTTDQGTMEVVTDGTKAWSAENPREYVVSDDKHREAVCMFAAHMRWSVVHIRAPGELSIAEQVQQAENRGYAQGSTDAERSIARFGELLV